MARGPLRNLLARPLAQQAAIVEALASLGAARLALLVGGFRRLARFLGTEGQVAPHPPAAAEPIGRLVALAVDAAARHAPWECRCFAQALAATAMLRRRGLPCTTYFGVARDEDQQFQAHAWVRCGAEFVAGGLGHERFAVVATYASPGASSAPRSGRRPSPV